MKFRNYSSYALVTGAASGMGRIYALRLALMGYNLIIVDINASELSETARIVKKKVASLLSVRTDGRIGGRTDGGTDGGTDRMNDDYNDFKVIPMVVDLSEKSAAENIAIETSKQGCVVEVLVNNAGLLPVNETVALSKKMISTTLMVHCYTSLMLCREFLPGMIERGNGYILNISSLSAWMSWPVIGLYGNTKRFVKDYSRSLRIECAGTGVSVTTAYFGAVDTPLIKLKPSLRKLAHALSIMISPEKAVDKALNAMFGRRKGVMPGVLNHIFKPFVIMMPDWLLILILKRARRFL